MGVGPQTTEIDALVFLCSTSDVYTLVAICQLEFYTNIMDTDMTFYASVNVIMFLGCPYVRPSVVNTYCDAIPLHLVEEF